MKVLLLHLSDIHLESEDDPVLQRAEKIVAAVRNIDYTIDQCVVVVSGDVAFSGQQEQLTEGWAFLMEVKDLLESEVGQSASDAPVQFVAVPGNHDCDFSKERRARQILIDSILESPEEAEDDSVVEICTSPQDAFFEDFLAVLNSEDRRSHPSQYGERLYYEYKFEVEQGDVSKLLRFRCCNTAWLSRLKEEQGELYFPQDAVTSGPEQQVADLDVSVFHHPYNWIEADSAGDFRERIESLSDIILTGHEHDGKRRTQEGESGERNQYIEAGALQVTGDPKQSSFNALLIDLEKQRQKFHRFAWNGSLYTPTATRKSEWEQFQMNRFREHKQFTTTGDTSDFLEDLGAGIEHPRAGALSLSDIFVYPDVRDLSDDEENSRNVFSASKLSDRIEEGEQILIVGDDKSGKTSLAKKLFKDVHKAGLVPIFLEGEEVHFPRSEEGLYDRMYEVFGDQYGDEQLETYRQLSTSSRAIIIDDYHKIDRSPSERSEILERLSKFADLLILTSDDLLADAENVVQAREHSSEGLSAFSSYHLEPFGNVLRDKLIEQWLLLDRTPHNRIAGVDLAHKVKELHRILNTIFGKNFVPSYPAYILPILHASETSIPVNTKASTHGYFYEILIRSTIARGRTQEGFDVLYGYLSHFAYALFSRSTHEMGRDDFNQIHEEYESRYDIDRNSQTMLDDLIESQVLQKQTERFSFKRSYFYYYFVAAYMADNIEKEGVREKISDLCRNLEIEENADILLFLAHLSKNSFIIEQMLDAADELFSEVTPATLDNDVDFFDDLRKEVEDVVYEERDPREARREMLEARDELDRFKESVPDASEGELEAIEDDDILHDEDVQDLRDIGVALRTLRILGQILKNFPGTLESDPKFRVAKASYELGFRLLSYFLNGVRNTRDDFIQLIVDRAREDDEDDVDILEVREEAKNLVASICRLASFGIIKRTANAVGSTELSNTYQRVEDEIDTPIAKLVNTSLALDYTRQSPKSKVIDMGDEFEYKPLPLATLKRLVVQYLYLYPVKREDKQRLCDVLDISYSRMQATDPSRKMIEG